MSEKQVKDYKERFEFKLMVGNNIIIQRYFKINNFNPRSLRSFELADAIRNCASVIDNELKSKTQTYLEIIAPMVFNTVEDMNKYFSDGKHASQMRIGNGISVKESAHDYFWGKNGQPVESQFKFDDNDFSTALTDEDRVDYKFSFCVDGREVCATIWTGVYPRYIRNSIDLSNKRGRQDPDDVSRLSFEQYLDYKLVDGRTELVWGIIKDICYVCSIQDNNYYTVTENYGNTVSKNFQDYRIWVDKNGEKVKSTSSKK